LPLDLTRELGVARATGCEEVLDGEEATPVRTREHPSYSRPGLQAKENGRGTLT